MVLSEERTTLQLGEMPDRSRQSECRRKRNRYVWGSEPRWWTENSGDHDCGGKCP